MAASAQLTILKGLSGLPPSPPPSHRVAISGPRPKHAIRPARHVPCPCWAGLPLANKAAARSRLIASATAGSACRILHIAGCFFGSVLNTRLGRRLIVQLVATESGSTRRWVAERRRCARSNRGSVERDLRMTLALIAFGISFAGMTVALPAPRARQGVTGHNVRYVLGFGLVVIVYPIFFG
jgi:hypothetical protein